MMLPPLISRFLISLICRFLEIIAPILDSLEVLQQL
jgi:hypothetical protein